MITYIKLVGYKRFALVGRTEFELKLTDPFVTILGTNGSGKSSLLSQMTPYPASAGDFEKTGSKETHHTYKSKKYIIKTIFQPQTRYYFECDGVVLNDWGTMLVQKSLVEEHFGLSSKLVDLLQSGIRFSSMGPNERKDWFVLLSQANYDYAIRVFNKARDRQRDLQGAIKLAKKRLSTETAKKVEEVEIKKTQQETQELSDFLDLLYEDKPRAEKSFDEFQDDSEILLDRIGKLQQLYEKVVKIISTDPHPQRVVEEFIKQVDVKLSYLSGANTQIEKQTNKAKQTLSILEKAKERSLSEIQKELKVIEERFQLLKSQFVTQPLLNNTANALDMFTAVQSELVDIIGDIPDNSENLFSRETRNAAIERVKQRGNVLKLLNKDYDKELAKLDHFNNHKEKLDTTCPKCNHNFPYLINPLEVERIKAKLLELQVKIESVESNNRADTEFIETATLYGQQIQRWRHIKSSTPLLSVWWEYLDDQKVFQSNQKHKTHWFVWLKEQLELQVKLESVYKLKQEKTNLIQKLQQVGIEDGFNSASDLKQAINQFGIDIELNTSRISQLQQTKKHYEDQLRAQKKLEEVTEKIKKLFNDSETLTKEGVHALRVSAYNEVIKETQRLLSDKRHHLHQLTNQQALLDQLTNQISEMELEEQAFATLANELSPKDGLVAEGLYGFIGQFFEDVNRIINRVWSYSMRLTSRLQESDAVELDYKFPVEIIKNEKIIIPDVNHGDGASKGQKEMIDMAFLVTAMSYLELDEFPLVLDEIGSAFDIEHKQKLMTLMKELVEQRLFPQILMVSHDFFQYTALRAQVVVLCDSNIKLR